MNDCLLRQAVEKVGAKDRNFVASNFEQIIMREFHLYAHCTLHKEHTPLSRSICFLSNGIPYFCLTRMVFVLFLCVRVRVSRCEICIRVRNMKWNRRPSASLYSPLHTVRSDCNGNGTKRAFISIFICFRPLHSFACICVLQNQCLSFAPILSDDCLFKSPLHTNLFNIYFYPLPLTHCYSLDRQIFVKQPFSLRLPFVYLRYWRTELQYHNPMPVVCASENQFSKTFNNKNFDTSAYVNHYGRGRTQNPSEIPMIRLNITENAIEYISRSKCEYRLWKIWEALDCSVDGSSITTNDVYQTPRTRTQKLCNNGMNEILSLREWI